MSNRPHAHSKRKRSGPPRSYNSATGLRGATEAELAHRARITEAALAQAERSADTSARLPRFTPAKANRGPATRSPRTFSLPSEPVLRTDADTHADAEADAADPADAGLVPDPVAARGGDPGTGTQRPAAPAAPATPATGRPGDGEQTTSSDPSPADPDGSGDSPAPREGSDRLRRALVARLSATAAAGAAVASRVRRADRSDSVGNRPGPPPARSEPPPAEVSGAPTGGGRWRRPATGGDGPRPESTPDQKRRLGRIALPTVGRKKGSPTTTKGSSSGTPTTKRTPSAPSAKGPARWRKAARQRTPATPEQRRRRIPVAIAGAFALAVLATSFPLSSILSQHHALTAAGAQLEQVEKENHDLAQQEHALDSSVAVTQLARGEYQMVTPGQTLYDVLPPSRQTGGSGKTSTTGTTGSTTPGSAVNGDPGNQPLVAPSNAPDLTAQAALAQPTPVEASATGGTTARDTAPAGQPVAPPSAPTSFWGRVGETIQFWK